MTNDELRGHLARIGPEFAAAGALFAEALATSHPKVDCTKPVPGSELADIYAGRRDSMQSRGDSMHGMDALVLALQSNIDAKWAFVGVSGGPYWAALFIPDDGSPVGCIAKRST